MIQKFQFLGIMVVLTLSSCQQNEFDAAKLDVFNRLHHQYQNQLFDKNEAAQALNEFQNHAIHTITNIKDASGPCLKEIQNIKKINTLKTAYLDALGKPDSGVLLGSLIWLGSYEECLSIPNAHYCSMKNIALNFSSRILSINYGICVPDECSVTDVTSILKEAKKTANEYLALLKISIIVSDTKKAMAQSFCHLKNPAYSGGAITMIVISSLILILCFVGTVVELTQGIISNYKAKMLNENFDMDFRTAEDNKITDETFGRNDEKEEPKTVSMHKVELDEEDSFLIRFLKCFSWVKNTKAVMSTNVPKGSITSINGIRTISITWVVLGHILFFTCTEGFSANTLSILKWLTRFTMRGISDATVSVDSFFLLSGCLVAYLSFKRMDTTGTLPLLRYYIHRYVRLTPSYAFLIFFMTFVLPYTNDGPFWGNEFEPNCKKYWWTNLLYINNWFQNDTEKVCYGVSWYLAIDMQYYIISPIILWTMFRFKTIGVLITSSIFFLQNFITNGIIVGVRNASPVFLLDNDPRTTSASYQKHVYFETYTRFGPYMVGILLGYILYYKKSIRGTLKLGIYLIGWLVASGVAIGIVYGPYANNGHASMGANILYSCLFRTLWAASVGWVIYACHNGYGGLINDFLSWKAFIPLSRLTYGVYLIHIYVIYFYTRSLQAPLVMTEIVMSFLFISITFISYVLSFLVSVCIEYPVFNLEQLVMSLFKQRSQKIKL